MASSGRMKLLICVFAVQTDSRRAAAILPSLQLHRNSSHTPRCLLYVAMSCTCAKCARFFQPSQPSIGSIGSISFNRRCVRLLATAISSAYRTKLAHVGQDQLLSFLAPAARHDSYARHLSENLRIGPHAIGKRVPVIIHSARRGFE
jgi:hypothetical protein